MNSGSSARFNSLEVSGSFPHGAGGQYTIIIPSHDLVVVRMGHYKGSDVGFEALCKSLSLLMQTIPGHEEK